MLLVTCWINPLAEIYHNTKWLSGLILLQERGLLKLRLKTPPRREPLFCNDTLIPFRVERNGEKVDGVLDLYDSSQLFPRESLSSCSLYFKRSYYAPDVAALGEYAHRVRHAGLNHSCRVPGLGRSLLAAITPACLSTPLHASRAYTKFLLTSPPATDFEQSPTSRVDRKVIYQTRVWEVNETTDDSVEEINEFRIALTLALRETFGPRFTGGLVPTPFAIKRYPHALATESWRKKDYIGMNKQNLIGVYTHGLHMSTGKKLPEYLAASQCVVAQAPRNPVSPEFLEGRNYLNFRNIEGCISACEQLLNDSERSQSMRQANHELYHQEVEPSAWVYRMIRELVGDSKISGFKPAQFAGTTGV